MTISAFSALGLLEFFYYCKLSLLMPCNHHLSNTFSIANDEICLRQVYQADLDFATIIGIYGARRIENRYPMLQCQTATGPYLSLKPCG